VVDGVQTTSTVYATTDQVNDIVRVIGEAKAAGRPYFIWGAFSAPHKPYQKPPNALHSRDGLSPSGAGQRAYYEAMVEALDTEIGRLLRSVDLATTTVIFLGDNGTPNEIIVEPPYDDNHAKLRVYEQGVRVPMIVAGAGVAAPGRQVTGLVNSVDLYPTILRLAGIDPGTVLPAGTRIDGVSILPYLENTATASVRGTAYAEKFDLAYNEQWEHAIRNTRYKLIERASGLRWPTREFFDLANDPYEKSNLLRRTLTSSQRTNLDRLNTALDALLATR
jgi:arylsulfatase A-like enzyme